MWFYGIITIQNLKHLEKSDHKCLLIKEYNWVLDLLVIQLCFFFKLIYFLAALGLRCCAWTFSSCSERGLLIAVSSLVVKTRTLGSRASVVVARRLSSCGAHAQYLWRTGLVAPRHVGSSWTRAQTRVPCIGRWILNHCTTREVQSNFETKIS